MGERGGCHLTGGKHCPIMTIFHHCQGKLMFHTVNINRTGFRGKLGVVILFVENTANFKHCFNADYITLTDSQCDKLISGLNLFVFPCLPWWCSPCKPCSRKQTPENGQNLGESENFENLKMVTIWSHFSHIWGEFDKRTPPARNPARKTPILRSCHSDCTFGCLHHLH